MANSTTGVLGLCSCCPDSTVTTTVNIIALVAFVVGWLFGLGALAGVIRGAVPEFQRTEMELQQMTENIHRIKRVFPRDLGSHLSTGTHILEGMTEYHRMLGIRIKSFESEIDEVGSKIAKVKNLVAHHKPLYSFLIWVGSRGDIERKMTRLRELSVKLSELHAGYVAE